MKSTMSIMYGDMAYVYTDVDDVGYEAHSVSFTGTDSDGKRLRVVTNLKYVREREIEETA